MACMQPIFLHIFAVGNLVLDATRTLMVYTINGQTLHRRPLVVKLFDLKLRRNVPYETRIRRRVFSWFYLWWWAFLFECFPGLLHGARLLGLEIQMKLQSRFFAMASFGR